MNRDWGKIKGENGIDYAPNPLYLDGFMIANPKPKHYLKAGYKPVTHTTMPTEEGYYFTPIYEDKGDYILEGWERHPIEPTEA